MRLQATVRIMMYDDSFPIPYFLINLTHAIPTFKYDQSTI